LRIGITNITANSDVTLINIYRLSGFKDINFRAIDIGNLSVTSNGNYFSNTTFEQVKINNVSRSPIIVG